MVSEVFAGLSAFKAMLDMAKALKDINDATVRNAAVIELQEKILAAREAQSALLDQVRDLEKEVADFETWETEKNRYKLQDLGWGALAYMLKPDARSTEPPHWVCTNCYGNSRISIIQYTFVKGAKNRGYYCPACHAEIGPSQDAFTNGVIKWLD